MILPFAVCHLPSAEQQVKRNEIIKAGRKGNGTINFWIGHKVGLRFLTLRIDFRG